MSRVGKPVGRGGGKPRSGRADMPRSEGKSGRSRGLSPLAEALAAVGDRWTLLVVSAMLDGAKRFNDLLEAVPGIAPNVLSDRLRRLEREGLVVAEAYSSRPPRSVYELTAAGRALVGAIRLLADWGARHSAEAEPRRHGECGTPLEARWYCPTCERPVDDAEGEEELDYI